MSTETMDVHIDCFVSGSFAVVLRVARFIGVAPLLFVKKKTGWRVSPSVGWAIYGYIFVIIASVITIGTLIAELQLDGKQTIHMQSKSSGIAWVISVIILIVISWTAVFGAPGQMRGMIACLNKVQKINYDLNIHHWPASSERKKTVSLILWIIVTLTLTCLDHTLLTIKMSWIGVETWIGLLYSVFYILFWICLMYELVFVTIALHVMYTFRAINNSLRILLSDFEQLPFITSFNNKQFKGNKKSPRFFNDKVNPLADSGKVLDRKTAGSSHETVHHLTLAYVQACGVVREVERCFGPCLVMMLGSYLWDLVLTPFNFITNILDRDTLEHNMAIYTLLVLVQFFWCIFHFFKLVMVTEPCHLTQTEIDTTCQLVSHLMRCTHSSYDPLAGELELFCRQLMLNKATYSPMNVTTISRSLVATIIGSITTYLVIIVQL